MADTDTTSLTEVIRTEAIGAAVLGFDSMPGVADLVTVASVAGRSTLKHVFPIIDNITAEAIAEGSDFTTTSAIDTSGSASATVSEHAVRSDITDLSIDATTEDFIGVPRGPVANAAAARAATLGTMQQRALGRLKDRDLTALFSGFNSSTGTNTGALTSTLLTDAISLLDENDIPEDNRVTVLHPTQFKPLVPVFDDASTFGAAGSQIIQTGSVSRLYGSEIFKTTNVGTATVTGSTVFAGAIMVPSAIGLVENGETANFEVERDSSARKTSVIATGVWGETEYRGGATTNGRGGAGIFFFSNTTNQ